MRTKLTGNISSMILFCTLCVFLFNRLTCDESLPPWVEPSGIYIVGLQIVAPFPDRIRRDIHQVEAGKGSIGLNVSVTNIFDETLTDTVRYWFGSIEIWWKENPDIMKTIPLTIRDETVTREIGFAGNIIFDPGDSIYLALVWPDLMDDANVSMWHHLTPTLTSEGWVYPAMDFEAQAKVQLFEQTAMVYSDIVRFRIYFYE